MIAGKLTKPPLAGTIKNLAGIVTFNCFKKDAKYPVQPFATVAVVVIYTHSKVQPVKKAVILPIDTQA